MRCLALVAAVVRLEVDEGAEIKDLATTTQVRTSQILPPLANGATIECGSTYTVTGVAGQGAQGKVYEVTRDEQAFALKIDVAADGAYHAGKKAKRLYDVPKFEYKSVDGVPDGIPDCRSLEYLKAKGVHHVPECVDSCLYEGHHALVMTLVPNHQHPGVVWNTLTPDQQRKFVQDTVEFLYDIINAEVSPSDVEAFVAGDTKQVSFVDWGGGMLATYESSYKYKDSVRILFEAALPPVHGLPAIFKSCRAPMPMLGTRAETDSERTVRLQHLEDVTMLAREAMCARREMPYKQWVVETAEAAVAHQLEVMRCSQVGPEILTCA